MKSSSLQDWCVIPRSLLARYQAMFLTRPGALSSFRRNGHGLYGINLDKILNYRVNLSVGVSGSAYGRHAWDVLLGAFTKPQLVVSCFPKW